jgi:hypothetical protein
MSRPPHYFVANRLDKHDERCNRCGQLWGSPRHIAPDDAAARVIAEAAWRAHEHTLKDRSDDDLPPSA